MTETDATGVAAFVSHLRNVTGLDMELEMGSDSEPSPSVVDAVLDGLAMRNPTILTDLAFSVPGGASAFVELARRLPSIATIVLGMHWCSQEFAAAMQAAVDRGYLDSLRSLEIDCAYAYSEDPDLESGPDLTPSVSPLLSTLTSSNIRDFRLIVPPATLGLLGTVSSLCMGTTTIRSVYVYAENVDSNVVADAGPLLRLGSRERSFAPSIEVVHLQNFFLAGEREGTALRNVVDLQLECCSVLNIGFLVRAMRRLRELSVEDYPTMSRRTFRTNDDLYGLCAALVLPRCKVVHLAISLVGNDGLHFPDTKLLLRVSKGSLSLRCYDFPESGLKPLLDGACRLHRELDCLKLHLKRCKFGDADVAALFETLIPNRTLRVLAMEFDHHAAKPLTLAAIESFVRENSHLRALSLFTPYDTETVPIAWEFRLEALRRVIGALATNRSLDTFRTFDLMIGADDRHELVNRLHQVLRENENGQCNDVFHTLVDDGKLLLPKDDPFPAAADVKFLLKLNRFGRRFLLRDDLQPLCHTGFWAKILAKFAGDGDRAVMFHFLKNKPRIPNEPVVPVAVRNVRCCIN
jgi:hypothetical protein